MTAKPNLGGGGCGFGRGGGFGGGAGGFGMLPIDMLIRSFTSGSILLVTDVLHPLDDFRSGPLEWQMYVIAASMASTT